MMDASLKAEKATSYEIAQTRSSASAQLNTLR